MKKIVFILSIAILTSFLVVRVQAQNSWIYGTVTSEPTVYSFNFQVQASSETLPSQNLTCLWPFQAVIGQTYNFSGILISDNSMDMPVGAFLVQDGPQVNDFSATTLTIVALILILGISAFVAFSFDELKPRKPS